MTINQYNFCVKETASHTSREAYISDLALSSIWSDTEDAPIPPDRIERLGEIWDACARTVKEIAAAAGLSQRKLAERFCIPYRTVENWGAGSRECPLYLRMMMQEILGLLNVLG